MNISFHNQMVPFFADLVKTTRNSVTDLIGIVEKTKVDVQNIADTFPNSWCGCCSLAVMDEVNQHIFLQNINVECLLSNIAFGNFATINCDFAIIKAKRLELDTLIVKGGAIIVADELLVNNLVINNTCIVTSNTNLLSTQYDSWFNPLNKSNNCLNLISRVETNNTNPQLMGNGVASTTQPQQAQVVAINNGSSSNQTAIPSSTRQSTLDELKKINWKDFAEIFPNNKCALEAAKDHGLFSNREYSQMQVLMKNPSSNDVAILIKGALDDCLPETDVDGLLKFVNSTLKYFAKKSTTTTQAAQTTTTQAAQTTASSSNTVS